MDVKYSSSIAEAREQAINALEETYNRGIDGKVEITLQNEGKEREVKVQEEKVVIIPNHKIKLNDIRMIPGTRYVYNVLVENLGDKKDKEHKTLGDDRVIYDHKGKVPKWIADNIRFDGLSVESVRNNPDLTYVYVMVKCGVKIYKNEPGKHGEYEVKTTPVFDFPFHTSFSLSFRLPEVLSNDDKRRIVNECKKVIWAYNYNTQYISYLDSIQYELIRCTDNQALRLMRKYYLHDQAYTENVRLVNAENVSVEIPKGAYREIVHGMRIKNYFGDEFDENQYAMVMLNKALAKDDIKRDAERKRIGEEKKSKDSKIEITKGSFCNQYNYKKIQVVRGIKLISVAPKHIEADHDCLIRAVIYVHNKSYEKKDRILVKCKGIRKRFNIKEGPIDYKDDVIKDIAKFMKTNIRINVFKGEILEEVREVTNDDVKVTANLVLMALRDADGLEFGHYYIIKGVYNRKRCEKCKCHYISHNLTSLNDHVHWESRTKMLKSYKLPQDGKGDILEEKVHSDKVRMFADQQDKIYIKPFLNAIKMLNPRRPDLGRIFGFDIETLNEDIKKEGDIECKNEYLQVRTLYSNAYLRASALTEDERRFILEVTDSNFDERIHGNVLKSIVSKVHIDFIGGNKDPMVMMLDEVHTLNDAHTLVAFNGKNFDFVKLLRALFEEAARFEMVNMMMDNNKIVYFEFSRRWTDDDKKLVEAYKQLILNKLKKLNLSKLHRDADLKDKVIWTVVDEEELKDHGRRRDEIIRKYPIHNIWDPACFLGFKSLKEVCKIFRLPKQMSKMSFDHSLIKTRADVETHKQKIIDYNMFDTISLLSIVFKLVNNQYDLFGSIAARLLKGQQWFYDAKLNRCVEKEVTGGPNILDYVTPSMFTYFFCLATNRYFIIKPTLEMERFLAKAVCGGRSMCGSFIQSRTSPENIEKLSKLADRKQKAEFADIPFIYTKEEQDLLAIVYDEVQDEFIIKLDVNSEYPYAMCCPIGKFTTDMDWAPKYLIDTFNYQCTNENFYCGISVKADMLLRYSDPSYLKIDYAKRREWNIDTIVKLPQGFYKVDITPPKNIVYPILPYRESDGAGIDWHLYRRIGVYDSNSIKDAVRNGYKLNWFYGGSVDIKGDLLEGVEGGAIVSQRVDDIFTPYIMELYNLRLGYKKTKDALRSLLCKELMNALYGKFAQKPRNTKYQICKTIAEQVEFYCDHDPKQSISLSEGRQLVIGERVEEMTSNKPLQIAVEILSYSKSVLLNYRKMLDPTLKDPTVLFYVDTDSLVISTKNLPSLLKCIDDDKIGMLKNEYGTGRGIYYQANSPKNYMELFITKKDIDPSKDEKIATYELGSSMKAKAIPKKLLKSDHYSIYKDKRLHNREYTDKELDTMVVTLENMYIKKILPINSKHPQDIDLYAGKLNRTVIDNDWGGAILKDNYFYPHGYEPDEVQSS
jgi:hypothetical protein